MSRTAPMWILSTGFDASMNDRRVLFCLFVCLFSFGLAFRNSGWRRASPTSRRASTGGRTWCATWPTTTSTTGCGRRSSSAARPTASTSRSSSPCATVRSSPARRSAARRPSRYSTTSSTPPRANRRRGSPRATSSSIASPPTRAASPPPTRYVPVSSLSAPPMMSTLTFLCDLSFLSLDLVFQSVLSMFLLSLRFL